VSGKDAATEWRLWLSVVGAYQFRIFGPENLGQLEEPYPLEKDGIHDPGGDKGSLPDGSHLP